MPKAVVIRRESKYKKGRSGYLNSTYEFASSTCKNLQIRKLCKMHKKEFPMWEDPICYCPSLGSTRANHHSSGFFFYSFANPSINFPKKEKRRKKESKIYLK